MTTKVICNAISSCHLCNGCGAAQYHHKMGCEPCPINTKAKCVPVKKEEPITINLIKYHLKRKEVLQAQVSDTKDQFIIYGLSRQIQEANRAIINALNSIILNPTS